MNFDISKLDSLPGKAGGVKAKPKFGPAIRARPKPQAKAVEAAEAPSAPIETGSDAPQAVVQQPLDSVTQPEEHDAQPAAGTNLLDGATDTARQGQGTAAEQPSEPRQVRRFKPAVGKRKDSEASAVPETGQALPETPAAAGSLALVPTDEADADANAVATQPDSGPMTKAKKRKGMGKGAGTRKPKTPLAEQKIDPVSMPLSTVIKVACAKDKVKAAAAKLAKQNAAASQASSQQSSPAQSPIPEPSITGVAQMVLDPETGELVIDPNSLTMQAQAPVQYARRGDGDDVLVNSMSHMRREASTRWTPEETEEFYAALGIFGTNFQAVADRLALRMAAQGSVGARRSRKQVKLKFNKEEKLHPRRIDATLRGQNAMPEDYVELIHDIKASRNEVQDDETVYLEAAPDSKAADGQTANTSTHQAAATDGQQPQAEGNCMVSMPQQPPAEPQPLTGKQARPLRVKPKVRGGARSSPEAAAAEAVQPAQPQAEEDPNKTRYTRMLQDSNMTAEDMQDMNGVY